MTLTKKVGISIALIFAFIQPAHSQSQTAMSSNGDGEIKPLWEFGVFAAAFNVPEYPAADKNSSNLIAVPYIVYRGDVIRIGDGSAARAVALEKDWIEIDLSLDAAFNADSSDNPVREGMPDIDYMFEVGPQIKFRLLKLSFEDAGNAKLSLDIKTRSVFSTDLSNFAHRGYVFHPEISYDHFDLFGEDSRLSINVAPNWGSEKLHDYFYQVSGEFTTDERPEYNAKGGYLGTEISIGLSTMVSNKIRVFAFTQINLHHGAANRVSPLFRDKDTYSVGLGVSWRVFESKEKAPIQQF
jgi:outer membrane protein